MNKSILYIFIFCATAFGAFYYVSSEVSAFEREINHLYSRQSYINPNSFNKKVLIVTPQANSHITSPIKISGSVSGSWFFEGQIVSKIIDEGGVVLGQGPLVATGDWMTNKDVGFEGVIPFTSSGDTKGYVVIEADSPSEATNVPSFKIPVIFDMDSSTACVGDNCGSCTTATLGAGGVCMKEGGKNKTL